jgi:hypothetical protein
LDQKIIESEAVRRDLQRDYTSTVAALKGVQQRAEAMFQAGLAETTKNFQVKLSEVNQQVKSEVGQREQLLERYNQLESMHQKTNEEKEALKLQVVQLETTHQERFAEHQKRSEEQSVVLSDELKMLREEQRAGKEVLITQQRELEVKLVQSDRINQVQLAEYQKSSEEQAKTIEQVQVVYKTQVETLKDEIEAIQSKQRVRDEAQGVQQKELETKQAQLEKAQQERFAGYQKKVEEQGAAQEAFATVRLAALNEELTKVKNKQNDDEDVRVVQLSGLKAELEEKIKEVDEAAWRAIKRNVAAIQNNENNIRVIQEQFTTRFNTIMEAHLALVEKVDGAEAARNERERVGTMLKSVGGLTAAASFFCPALIPVAAVVNIASRVV